MRDWKLQFISASEWVLFDGGKVYDWSPKLNGVVRNILESSAGKGKRVTRGGISIFACNDKATHYYIGFTDGSYIHRGPDGFHEEIETYERIDFVTIGPDGQCIISGKKKNGGAYWGCGGTVPNRASEALHNSSSAPKFAALGTDGNYYIMFWDGHAVWDGPNKDKLTPLVTGAGLKGRTVVHVALSPSETHARPHHYYVGYNDGSSVWSHCPSLTNALKSDIKYVSPFEVLYVNDSIAETVVCGKSIYATKDALVDGSLHPEEIPAMQIFEYQGKRYTLSHRRLWCFKQAGLPSVPARFMDGKETQNEKKRIRQGAGQNYIRVKLNPEPEAE
jgi:hypothetical protein